MNHNGQSIHKTTNIYAGFNPLTQKALAFWGNRIITYGKDEVFQNVIDDINHELVENNLVLFFDHHYAFDALPLGVALGNHIDRTATIIIPYAVHLDMGLGREGERSLRYWIRTRAFHWFLERIIKENPQIQFFPVVREFELETPRLKKVVDEKYDGINTVYLRTFIRRFSENPSGEVCFLTPFSGIGFPGKPVLHPQLYRSIKLVMAKTNHKVSFYITGAYPEWGAYQSYLAPLFMEHRIYLRGPFELPIQEYQEASRVLENELIQLRKTAEFIPPDYSKLLTK